MIDFQIQGDGKHWATDVDKENGSFDYLMFVSLLPVKGELWGGLMRIRPIVSVAAGSERGVVELILNCSWPFTPGCWGRTQVSHDMTTFHQFGCWRLALANGVNGSSKRQVPTVSGSTPSNTSLWVIHSVVLLSVPYANIRCLIYSNLSLPSLSSNFEKARTPRQRLSASESSGMVRNVILPWIGLRRDIDQPCRLCRRSWSISWWTWDTVFLLWLMLARFVQNCFFTVFFEQRG